MKAARSTQILALWLVLYPVGTLFCFPTQSVCTLSCWYSFLISNLDCVGILSCWYHPYFPTQTVGTLCWHSFCWYSFLFSNSDCWYTFLFSNSGCWYSFCWHSFCWYSFLFSNSDCWYSFCWYSFCWYSFCWHSFLFDRLYWYSFLLALFLF